MADPLKLYKCCKILLAVVLCNLLYILFDFKTFSIEVNTKVIRKGQRTHYSVAAREP